MTQISHNITRETTITEFLKAAGWDQAAREPILGDASTRRYERLYQDGDHAILMDAPRGAEMASAPKMATEQQRRELGYNACARLAGPNLEAFAAIAQALTQRGFSAPKIIAANIEQGLFKDKFGDVAF